VALIAVSADGENQIVVASGANAAFTPDQLPNGRLAEALICQLELPVGTVAAAVDRAEGFVCLNVAPAQDVPDAVLRRADLLVANEGEAAAFGDRLHAGGGLVAVTRGVRGARLYQRGRLMAEAAPPSVQALDATGAGDVFVSALTVALLEARDPSDSLAFACAAAALSVTRAGAQPSAPWGEDVEAVLAGRREGATA
jgi:ribokinase